ncbi:glycosyltransferase [Soonwooa purpurea]
MKKRIVFVIESLHLGGAEKSLVTLLQNLDYNLYEVDLITFHKAGFFREFVPAEVNQIQITFPKLSLIDRLCFAIKKKRRKKMHPAQLFWPIVSSYFKKIEKQYDIAIAYNQGFATYFAADKILATKKLAWLNTDYQKAGYEFEKDKEFYTKFNKVVTVSQEADASFRKAFQKSSSVIETEVIKDISDDRIIKEQANKKLECNFNPSEINIVSVGRLISYKGFHLAIEACKILIGKGYPIHWYVVGEGTERSSLEKQIANNNLEKSFSLLGANTNPYPYMKACDIYVQTSLFEGLGLTVIEASILQKPIVCTNFSTAFGILKDNETGLIAEMTAESIAENIERLINDVELKNKLIANLSQQKNKDKEESLSKIEQLLKS